MEAAKILAGGLPFEEGRALKAARVPFKVAAVRLGGAGPRSARPGDLQFVCTWKQASKAAFPTILAAHENLNILAYAMIILIISTLE